MLSCAHLVGWAMQVAHDRLSRGYLSAEKQDSPIEAMVSILCLSSFTKSAASRNTDSLTVRRPNSGRACARVRAGG